MAMSGSGDITSAVCLVSVTSPTESVSGSVCLGLGVVSIILYKQQRKQFVIHLHVPGMPCWLIDLLTNTEDLTQWKTDLTIEGQND